MLEPQISMGYTFFVFGALVYVFQPLPHDVGFVSSLKALGSLLLLTAVIVAILAILVAAGVDVPGPDGAVLFS